MTKAASSRGSKPSSRSTVEPTPTESAIQRDIHKLLKALPTEVEARPVEEWTSFDFLLEEPEEEKPAKKEQ